MQLFAILILFSLISQSVAKVAVPSITAELPEVKADLGDDVRLTCIIKDGQEYPLFWMRLDNKGSSFPISTGPNLLISDKRFTLDHDVESGSYTLTIQRVQPGDVATYQCQVVISLHKMITDNVKLIARLPPVIVDEPSTRRVRVAEKETAKLNCEAEGYPKPTITWQKEDGQVLPSGQEETTVQTLIIPNVRKEDRGAYLCIAHNGVGENTSRAVTLDVEFPPIVEVLKPRIAQAVNYDVKLVCNIRAYPAPTIFWKKDEDIITLSDSHQISHFASQGDITTTSLKIVNVRNDQFGHYKCEASNRHGSANQIMELYKSVMPICPPVCGDINLNKAPDIKRNNTFLALICTLILFLI